MAALPSNLTAFPIPRAVLAVIERLHQQGFAAYLVGGCVRDMLRGQPPKDWDVATSAHPPEVIRAFKKVIPTGVQHGTVTVVHEHQHVEVTTFRSEGDYADGRRPNTVEFKSEVADDLSRRDFTINAMAFDPAKGALVDPFGGTVDLDAGVIRCVGSALTRFSEDGLRALRALRFATVLGFTIEPSTLAAIPQTVHVFRKVSQERIRVELEKLLLARLCAGGLELLRSTTLLPEFLPEALGEGFDLRAAAAQAAPASLELRLAAWLSHGQAAVIREALKRLTFPNKLAERTGLLLQHRLPGSPLRATELELRRWLAAIGKEAARDATELHLAVHGADDPAAVRGRVQALLESQPPTTARELVLNGAAIMRVLGVGPSPAVGEATRFLLDQVIEDPARNSEPALTDLLRNWAKSRGL